MAYEWHEMAVRPWNSGTGVVQVPPPVDLYPHFLGVSPRQKGYFGCGNRRESEVLKTVEA